MNTKGSKTVEVMIYNTTYRNKDYEEEASKLLGKPFSFFQRIKMNGIGSGRLVVEELSPKLDPGEKHFSDLSYGNMELRPHGIIVHFSWGLKRFSWCIPYYKLVLYRAEFFSVHAEGHYIKFKKDKHLKSNERFVSKLLDLRNKFLEASNPE